MPPWCSLGTQSRESFSGCLRAWRVGFSTCGWRRTKIAAGGSMNESRRDEIRRRSREIGDRIEELRRRTSTDLEDARSYARETLQDAREKAALAEQHAAKAYLRAAAAHRAAADLHDAVADSMQARGDERGAARHRMAARDDRAHADRETSKLLTSHVEPPKPSEPTLRPAPIDEPVRAAQE